MATCVIIDDEPLARKLMINHLSKIEGLTIVYECNNALDASSWLQKYKTDLLFLDIQMPELTGLQFIKALKNPPSIILVTAHREYAVEAFDLDVIDYLLKPVSFDRLLKSVNKFFSTRRPFSLDLPDSKTFIYVKSERKMIKVILDEIVYIESLDDYVKIHLTDKVKVTRENISALEQLLPREKFVRVHRSYIISCNKLIGLTGEYIAIANKQIPFGRAYKQAALARLGINP